jgi:hypothetical protein
MFMLVSGLFGVEREQNLGFTLELIVIDLLLNVNFHINSVMKKGKIS